MSEAIHYLGDTVDKCPYDYYAEARARDAVTWEQPTKNWIAATYAAVRDVLTDEDTFARPLPTEIVPSEKYSRIVASPFSLVGKERLAHRRWWLEIFNTREIERYRHGVVADVVEATIDEIAPRGRAELVQEYAERVSDRVIAGVLGLPWRDDDYMTAIRTNLNKIEHYKGIVYLKPEDAIPHAEIALAATYEVDALLRPYMDQCKKTADDSIISRVWRDDALDGWTEDARYGLVRTFFAGGSDTTRTSMVNALHLILATPGMLQKVRRADARTLGAFVEEALRLVGTVHFRNRICQRDSDLDGAQVHRGDKVAAVIASGNRDAARFDDPDEINLERKNPRQHLAFSVGIGACAGSPLARVELQEGVSRIVNRLEDLRLDPDAPRPGLEGSIFKLTTPVHVLFTAQRE
ncbi:cytochrome P450 [Mycobacterium sp.]|uniref:cytochrome P450 n=1 Tax=Mycobacterium sp. TaxID=1785 RepID=UPI003BB0B66E